MIKVQVKERFHLDRFDELENIQRYDKNKNKEGYLYEKDTFECTEEMVEYLTKKNKNFLKYNKERPGTPGLQKLSYPTMDPSSTSRT